MARIRLAQRRRPTERAISSFGGLSGMKYSRDLDGLPVDPVDYLLKRAKKAPHEATLSWVPLAILSDGLAGAFSQ